MNSLEAHAELVQQKLDKCRKIQVSEHLLRQIQTVMTGGELSPRRAPEKAQRWHQSQREIGWGNFVRGRIHKEWAGSQEAADPEDCIPGHLWRRRLVRILLTWAHEKWLLRCSEAGKQTGTAEHRRLLRECREIWEA